MIAGIVFQYSRVDSKALESHARGRKDPGDNSDPEADWGSKKKQVKRSAGSLWEKVSTWFGYKLHLVVDSHYELPVGFQFTRASVSDSPELLPLVQDLKERQAEIVERAVQLMTGVMTRGRIIKSCGRITG